MTSGSDGVFLDIGLPKPNDVPAGCLKHSRVSLISFYIALYLGRPIGRISAVLKLAAQFKPFSPMPKIAITKDNNPSTRKYNIRLSRKVSYVLPIAKPEAPQRTT